MTRSSKILLINLVIFLAYALFTKISRDVGVLFTLLIIQFFVNIILGFADSKAGRGFYFLSAFLVLILGFTTCAAGFY